MSRLTSSQYNNHKSTRHFCFRCLNSFQNVDSLRKHVEYRSEHGTVKIKMPVKGTKCYFKHHGKKIPVPFAIYADFETFLKPIDTCQPNPWKSYTNRYHVHIPSAFSYFIKCFDDEVYLKPPTVYTAKSVGENVAEIFFNRLKEDVKSIYHNVLKKEKQKKMIFGEEDRKRYFEETECWICGGEFYCGKKEDKELYDKRQVRDHCHFTGKYRGAAHKKCNRNARIPKFIPVIFYNLSGYDAHLFIKALGKKERGYQLYP